MNAKADDEVMTRELGSFDGITALARVDEDEDGEHEEIVLSWTGVYAPHKFAEFTDKLLRSIAGKEAHENEDHEDEDGEDVGEQLVATLSIYAKSWENHLEIMEGMLPAIADETRDALFSKTFMVMPSRFSGILSMAIATGDACYFASATAEFNDQTCSITIPREEFWAVMRDALTLQFLGRDASAGLAFFLDTISLKAEEFFDLE